jgi:hypothetical protein
MLYGHYSKHLVVDIRNINVFVFFHIHGLHISARTLPDFRRSAWLESPISHFANSDIQIYFIYLLSHTVLLLFIFIVFRVLDSIMSYGRSKHAIKVNYFDRSNFWECKDVDISISLKKNQNYALWELFETACRLYSKYKWFRFLSYPGTTYLCKHPARFLFVISRRWLSTSRRTRS